MKLRTRLTVFVALMVVITFGLAMFLNLHISSHDADSDRLFTSHPYSANLLAIIAVVFLSLLLASLISRAIVQPLYKISEGAQKIGAGDLDAWIDIESSDELGELAEAFNSMSRQLKMNLQKFKDSEFRYRVLVENAYDGIITGDNQGKIISWNNGAERIFGYTSEEAIGKRLIDLIAGKSQRNEVEENVKRMASGEPINFEAVRTRKDGELINVLVTVTPLKNDDGKVFGFAGIIMDVTEQRKLEKRQRALELEIIRKGRLATLGTLLQGLAHNINNPLAAISMQIELLKMRKFEDIDKAADLIEKQLEKLTNMVKILLQKSIHDEEGEKDWFDINDVLESELELLDTKPWVKTNVSIKRNFSKIPKLFGLSSDFNQSFANIMDNAIASMHDSDDKILTVTTQNLNNKFIRIEISDTGCGIHEDHISRIFDPFFTTKASVSKEAPTGTGLGLHSVYTLLSDYGAKFGVDSRVGQGTTFRVDIPVTEEEPKAED